MSDELRPMIDALWSVDEAARLRAAQELSGLGPRAAEAVPDLVQKLEDESEKVALEAYSALRKVGVAGIPHLLRFMRNPQEDEKFRWYAAEALADLGPESLPHLLQAMDDQDLAVRMMAIDSLPRMGNAADSAVPKIAEFLNKTNGNLVQSSAVSLAQIALHSTNPGTSPAMKTLLSAVKSESATLRRAVISAFESTGDKLSKVGPALQALKEATQDQDEEIRENAVWLLNRLEIEH